MKTKHKKLSEEIGKPISRHADIKSIITRWYGSRLSGFIECVITGVITGFLVVFFRLAINKIDDLRLAGYALVRTKGFPAVAASLVILAAAGILLGWMSKKKPMIKGSGIPQVKGALLRQMKLEWLLELPMKIIGGALGIGLGMSLGREGPSVQIGAYAGKAVLTVTKRPDLERKYLLTSGAAAGLSAAFNAPLAGVLFALEEMHRNFSPLLLACVMGASVAGNFVAGYFFGLEPVFDFKFISPLDIKYFPLIILLGITCSFGGDLFKRMLYAGQTAYTKLKIPQVLRPVLPLLLSLPLGLYLSNATGGGHRLIQELSQHSFSIGMLVLLLAVRLLFTACCYGSGSAGGIFLPLLVCGALTGAIFGKVVSLVHLPLADATLSFMILGMAAFFTAVVRAPVTGAVLILEMSGNFNHLGGLILACLSSFIVSDLIKSRAVYEVLLEKLLMRNPGIYKPTTGSKTLIEIPVCSGSVMANMRVESLKWPEGCLVVGIVRGEKEIIPGGSTEIFPGDNVLVLTDEEKAPSHMIILLEMGEENRL